MRKLLAFAWLGFIGATTGCGTAWYAPPDQFAAAPYSWVHNPSVQHHVYDLVVQDFDVVRAGFVKTLIEDCRDAIIDAHVRVGMRNADRDPTPLVPVAGGDGKKPASTNNADCVSTSLTDPTAYSCWVRKYRSASMCADVVTLHANDQCVAKSGAQNTFSAKANIVLGSVLSVGGLAADAAALASHGSNATVAVAAGSAVNSGVNNVKTFAPATTTSKVGDFVMAEQSYVALARFNDAELNALYPLINRNDLEQSPYPLAYPSRAHAVALRYARLHDAVFAVCPVGAY